MGTVIITQNTRRINTFITAGAAKFDMEIDYYMSEKAYFYLHLSGQFGVFVISLAKQQKSIKSVCFQVDDFTIKNNLTSLNRVIFRFCFLVNIF